MGQATPVLFCHRCGASASLSTKGPFVCTYCGSPLPEAPGLPDQKEQDSSRLAVEIAQQRMEKELGEKRLEMSRILSHQRSGCGMVLAGMILWFIILVLSSAVLRLLPDMLWRVIAAFLLHGTILALALHSFLKRSENQRRIRLRMDLLAQEIRELENRADII